MTWTNLRAEVEDMFALLSVPSVDWFGMTVCKRSIDRPERGPYRERPEDVVARVARWREKNRSRRNANARRAWARKVGSNYRPRGERKTTQ